MTAESELLLNVSGAAKLLGISPRHFWSLVGQGILPKPIKLGNSTRWRISDLRASVAAIKPVG